jgi:uncharacterized protein
MASDAAVRSERPAARVGASGLPVRKVEATLETQEFWDATAKGELLLRKCEDCSSIIWYPRAFCPACSSQNTSWITSSGRGTVYSFSITRKGAGAWAEKGPYVIAYVELEEGPRVLTNIVGCSVDDVCIGLPVEVVFDDTGEGMAIYRFAPPVKQ